MPFPNGGDSHVAQALRSIDCMDSSIVEMQRCVSSEVWCVPRRETTSQSRMRQLPTKPQWRDGIVESSSAVSIVIASSALVPHIAICGRSRVHTAGRSGFPNNAHRLESVNWTQRMPAGLPCGIPGIGEEIEGAMQHAPQPERHSIVINRLHAWVIHCAIACTRNRFPGVRHATTKTIQRLVRRACPSHPALVARVPPAPRR